MTSEIALNIANTSGLDPGRSASIPSGAKARSRPQAGSGSVIHMTRPDASVQKTENNDKKTEGNKLLLKSIQHEFNLINNVELKFDRDQETNEAYIKIVDKDSGDVVREIPPEALRKLAEKMDEMVGILFDKKA